MISFNSRVRQRGPAWERPRPAAAGHRGEHARDALRGGPSLRCDEARGVAHLPALRGVQGHPDHPEGGQDHEEDVHPVLRGL